MFHIFDDKKIKYYKLVFILTLSRKKQTFNKLYFEIDSNIQIFFKNNLKIAYISNRAMIKFK